MSAARTSLVTAAETGQILQVLCRLDRVLRGVRRTMTFVVRGAVRSLRDALRPWPVLGGFVADLRRSRDELIAENALLRQQLIVASRSVHRPVFRGHERGLLVLLTRLVPRWRDAMLLVKPETILRWHRNGFRLFWRRKARPSLRREPRLDADVIELIGRMAKDNRLWGAERIRGELLKLGIHVAKRTLQRYMRGARPPEQHRGQSWATFLKNHAVWTCDFLQLYDIWFRPIFAFFIVDLHSRKVVHIGVTRAPSAQWTAQQLREATPFGVGPDIIVRDRDDKYSAVFDRVAKGVGARVVRTAVEAPLMNSVVERFLGSVRRECLDHVIVLGERHLENVLREYAVRYFNSERPHQGIAQSVPVSALRATYLPNAVVDAISVLGGLHHAYRVAA